MSVFSCLPVLYLLRCSIPCLSDYIIVHIYILIFFVQNQLVKALPNIVNITMDIIILEVPENQLFKIET